MEFKVMAIQNLWEDMYSFVFCVLWFRSYEMGLGNHMNTPMPVKQS